MEDQTVSGAPTRSGRIPNLRKHAVDALKSLVPSKKRSRKSGTTETDSGSNASKSDDGSIDEEPPVKKGKGMVGRIFKRKEKDIEAAPSTSTNGEASSSKKSGKDTSSSTKPEPKKQTGPSRKATVIDITGDDSDDDDDEAEVDDVPEEPEESAEKELERLMAGWNAPIYAFFHPVPTIGHENGRRYHEFHCFAKSCNRTVRRYLDKKDMGSTSNLHKHAKTCWGSETVQAALGVKNAKEARDVLSKSKDGSIAAAFAIKGKGKVTYSHRQHTRAETRAEIVRWVSENARPFNIVSDRGFKNLMKTGRPEYYLPSPSTVSRDVRVVFARSRQRIAAMLRKHEGKLHFATDAWTSPNHRAFVAVTVHFEMDGVPVCMILDVVEVAKSHSGVNLAVAFADILNEYGLSEKILSVTCDNASNNDVMIAELAELLPEFSVVNHTRCFLHVNNLVARSLVRQFDVPKAASPTEDPVDTELRDLAANIDVEDLQTREALLADIGTNELENDDLVEGWVDEIAALSPIERTAHQESLRPVRKMLVKVRKLAFKTINSTTLLLPAWEKCLEDLKMASRLMPRDVPTRWNSTYDMLVFALEHRAAIDKFSADRNNDLRQFELDEEEWGLVEELVDVLQLLKHATLFFSRSTPNLAKVIPIMDIINDRLTAKAIDPSLSPAIRAAIGLAKKTLNRYYSRTDEVEPYRIAMILHPQYKLEYFKDANWQPEWIQTAEDLLRTQYEDNYRKYVQRGSDEPQSSNPERSSSFRQTAASKESNIFDKLLSKSAGAGKSYDSRDEIDRYLATETEVVDNPLLWWSERRSMYPGLSRMALDYLSIPATSVDVERVFSRGRLILSHIRSRLSAQSTRALLCLGNWSLRGYIKDSDVNVAARMPDIDGEEQEMEEGWDRILLDS